MLQKTKKWRGSLDGLGEEMSLAGQEKELHFLEFSARSEVHEGIWHLCGSEDAAIGYQVATSSILGFWKSLKFLFAEGIWGETKYRKCKGFQKQYCRKTATNDILAALSSLGTINCPWCVSGDFPLFRNLSHFLKSHVESSFYERFLKGWGICPWFLAFCRATSWN